MFSQKPTNQQDLAKSIANLTYDAKAQEYANAYGGFKIMNVSWEDCGRSQNSSGGPNISDMTLCVGDLNMPVIRKPNFTDITADMSIDHFTLTVGNENRQVLSKVSLRDFLKDIPKYTGNPNMVPMYLPRDEHILTSTQACILPLRDGKVEFNVKLFNYQYDEEDPAVLCIVSSKNGTSVQVITEYNQPLYFNDNGFAANFVAQRLSDHRTEKGSSNTGSMTREEQESNSLFIFQIPLKQTKEKRVYPMYSMYGGGSILESMPVDACIEEDFEVKGYEDAIISTGEVHSEFKGTGSLKLVRDDRFPIRCVFQTYGVTDTVNIPPEVFKTISEKLERPYKHAVKTGSLVVEKDTGRLTANDVKQESSLFPTVCIW